MKANSTRPPAVAWVAAIAVLLLLVACSRAESIVAQEPADDTVCALDGMTLKDFPGPKAQIRYAEGAPDFMCNVLELFATVLAPEQRRRITAMLVQDMGKADWDHPSGHWIDAKKAIYVVGSKRTGSMGPTFGAFSSAHDADEFVKKEGGKALRFDQITIDMLNAGKLH